MKKIIWLFLSIFVLWSVFAYTPTATDQAMAQAFIKRIEEIRVENPQQFESLKNLLPLLVEQTKSKPKSYYIFSSLYTHFIGALDDATQTDSSLISVSVVRVIDGDTLVVDYNGKEERVRLIGVDTPETVHPTKWVDPYGQEASDFAKNALENKTVQLEFDVEERDQYGRLLAYVWINGKMFNKTLLEEGYGYLSTWAPNVKYVDEFTTLQQQALAEQKWLWQLDEYVATQSVNINTATIEELKNIIHIDEVRAAEIIELRPFVKVEDLTRVYWIGPARIADIIAEGVATVE